MPRISLHPYESPVYNGHMQFISCLQLALFFCLSSLSAFQLDHRLEEREDEQVPYRVTKPHDQGYLKVSDSHTVYYAIYGNPKGIPVLIVHGGPGGGCGDGLTRFFDLSLWKVIMFDQRGSLRSLPFGELTENTPQHSIEDMESLRHHLGIDRWVLFGGSWGSTLAILYGEEHPEASIGFILRGVFLGREQDYKYIVDGMGKFFPEEHKQLVQYIPKDERNDLIEAYYRRVSSSDPQVSQPAARVFMKYDFVCSTFCPDPKGVESLLSHQELCLNMAKTFLYYARNRFFLEENQLLNRIDRVKNLPALIIQGRWDAICPPEMAYLLYEKWDNSQLWIVSRGGHSSGELPYTASLVRATDLFAKKVIEEQGLSLSPQNKFWNKWIPFRRNKI